MKEKTIFPREEKSEVLFDKILSDKWAYNKLFQTFCDNLFCNDDSGTDLSPLQFTEALFNCYTNKDLSAFLMAISQNTLFDLLRNSFLIPYRFNADGKQNPIIMTDDNEEIRNSDARLIGKSTCWHTGMEERVRENENRENQDRCADHRRRYGRMLCSLCDRQKKRQKSSDRRESEY